MKLTAVKEAICELQAQIALVASMIEGKSRTLDDERKWLQTIDSQLDVLWDGIEDGNIDVHTIQGIDDPDVSVLDSTLSECESFESSDDRGDARLLRRCVHFWLDDIRRRGYGLLYLLTDQVLTLDAKHAYEALRGLRYP